MSRHTYIPFLDDPRPDEKPGDPWEGEIWWAERQDTCFGLDTVLVGGHHESALISTMVISRMDRVSM